MLAKCNLYVGNIARDDATEINPISEPTGIQNSTAIGWQNGNVINVGVLEFSLSNYWKDYTNIYPAEIYNENSSIYIHNQNYKDYLESLGVIVNESRVISKTELTELGCQIISASSADCRKTSAWVHSTSYWTGIAYSDNEIWSVASTGGIGTGKPSRVTRIGVRPVIEIPLTEF